MRRSLVFIFLMLGSASLAACTSTPVTSGPAAALGPSPVMRVLATGLADPWELLWGPDNDLWVTEKIGKRVDRFDPSDGSRTTVLTIPDVSASGAQDGLLGMAFGDEALYLAYSYNANPGPPVNLRGKIVRYDYDQATEVLRNPVDVMTNLPTSRDHNAGRLLFGPDQKLYYSIGDQGNNQFDRACLPIGAQNQPTQTQVEAKDWNSYTGKILRVNTDGTVPADNPVIHGVRSHIFSYGHRNPEGLVFGPGGRLFSSEHGPKSDDEINLLQSGKNYGWPMVAGFRDDQAYRYANWSAAPDCRQLGYSDYTIPASVPLGPKETEWNDPDYVEPVKTIYTVPSSHNFQDPACGSDFYLCWPSIAPGNIDYLPADHAPSPLLANALLVPSLKEGTLFVLKLTGDGGSVQGDTEQLFPTRNRYRDTAISPDHTKIYIATDSRGSSGPQSLQHTGRLDNPGSILEFTLTVPAAPPPPAR